MSRIWPSVTKQQPCIICGKPDWCVVGDYKVVCMRVESPHPCRSGGWYHDREKQTFRPYQKLAVKRAIASINLKERFEQWVLRTSDGQRQALANTLSLSQAALDSLGPAWAQSHNAWAFPMRDENEKIVGIRLRSYGGAKWAVPGSRQGLFIPLGTPASPCYIAEGPTSTAALLQLGFYAVGRASCQTGADQLRLFLKLVNVHRVVIVADNDKKYRPVSGEFWSPGVEGAVKLGKELGVKHIVWVPPTKDVRDFLIKGGTAKDIENSVNQFTWTK